MAWKIKEQYKDIKLGSMSLILGKLKPHQIENLSDEAKNKYFTNDTPKPKKKKKEIKIETESYNEYTD